MLVLEVEDLTVYYQTISVLLRVTFTLSGKKIVGILGPNGAGKSTLVKTLLGLVKPVSGKVRFFGDSIEQVRHKVGYVPQRASVDWTFPMTALDLVMMGRYGKMKFLKWATRADKSAAWDALGMVEMESYAHRQIGQLSGGQQQRLFIARALAQGADMYILDEPFAGIDIITEKKLMQLFERLRENGKTILMVHHDLTSAEQYFDQVLLLNICLIAQGSTKETLNRTNLMRTYTQGEVLLQETTTRVHHKNSGII